MNEGRLVQHQQNPSWLHEIKTYDEKTIEITSTHHQAAYPFDLPAERYRVLGWTTGISKFHEDGNREEMNPPVECENVYYPETRCLGIQGHPEMMKSSHPTLPYLRLLLNKHLSNTILDDYEIYDKSKEGKRLDDVQTENTVETSVA